METKEKERCKYKNFDKGYFHLCLDRLEGRNIFNTDEAYRAGMAGVGLSTIRFDIKIYAFELMPNHAHIILSGTGNDCVKVFSFLKRRFSEVLLEEGYEALPNDYSFKLIPILDMRQLRDQILYTLRNPYEKGWCVPGGHKWGSGYLLFNELSSCLNGKKVSEFGKRKAREILRTGMEPPQDWIIHPHLGLLPSCFVCTDKLKSVFSSPKEYLTRAVKDYESFARISSALGEHIEYDKAEIRDMVFSETRKLFPSKNIDTLTSDEKLRIASTVASRYINAPTELASILNIHDHLIRQALRSKDFGIK